jgi:tetratricopeptide (TPR) repeat protein
MSWRARVLGAIVTIAALAAPGYAQGVRMERPTPNVIELTDGAWRIRYGTTGRGPTQPQLVVVSPERAYFVHGPWLRLLDSAKGMVIGRWRFPGFVEMVTDAGAGNVDVRFQLSPGHVSPNMTVRFNPATGDVPQWDNGGLLGYRVAEWEAVELVRTAAQFEDWPKTAAGASDALPLFEELIARDPSAPMFRLMRAKLFREAGDPRADEALAAVFEAGSNDFTEWFRISRIFALLPQPEPMLAARAYDRAFRDFIARGRDPRLVDTLIARLVLFLPGEAIRTSEPVRRSYLDQLYPLAPTSEASERGWDVHARALAQAGDETAAAVWRERAGTSRRESLYLATLDFQIRHDRGQLLAITSTLAAIIFLVTRRAKYMPQMKMRRTAATRSGQRAEWVFGALAYWTRRERWSLLLLVVMGWLAIGYSRTYAQVAARAFAMPVRAGMISGPENFDRYPPSDERTLLQAISKQVVNDAADAERLYRSIPQFAESWNNLGVLLARAGREAESRDAFARALAIEPALGEAIVNTTGRATTQATQTFQKYAPAGMKMMALPKRERVLRAFVGPAWAQRYARMWLGPFEVFQSMHITDYQAVVLFRPALVTGLVLLVILIVALGLVALIPKRDATVPPSRATGIIELVIPGLAASWRWAGMFVLLAWCTGLLAAFFQVTVSSPYFLMAISQPGILRAFGYDSAYFDLNPPMALLLGVPIVLWLANAALIRASRTSP